MRFLFCSHAFVPSPDKDGVIYCEKCGKTKVLPCQHKWETISGGDIKRTKNDSCVGEIYSLRCKKCGEIKFMGHSI